MRGEEFHNEPPCPASVFPCLLFTHFNLQHIIIERSRMKRYLIAVIMIFSLAVMSGCNTMSGIGKDIEQAGDAIENAAKKNKSN